MSGERGQTETGDAGPPEISHRRVLVLMAAIVGLGSLAGLLAATPRFSAGVLLGGSMAVAGYAWLTRSVREMFEAAAEGRIRQFQAARFFARYLIIGAVLLGIHLSGAFPMTAVLLGLSSFAGAVVVEGLSRALAGSGSDREN